MWLAPFIPNPIVQDIVAMVITLAVALIFLRSMDMLAHRGLMDQRLSRKIIHIGTGPLFIGCLNLFSDQWHAPYFAAAVPMLITVQFFAVGMGLIDDPAAVKALSRSGDRREILRGPLYYGIIFVICTIVFWRHSPLGVLALMVMCGGDGLADVVGRRLGAVKLPFNANKSYAGSGAMFLGSFVFGFGFLAFYNALGNFDPMLSLTATAVSVGIISLVATLVESLPFHDIDNVTITVTALILGVFLF